MSFKDFLSYFNKIDKPLVITGGIGEDIRIINNKDIIEINTNSEFT